MFIGNAYAVSGETSFVINIALKVSKTANGAFDIAVTPVIVEFASKYAKIRFRTAHQHRMSLCLFSFCFPLPVD